MKLQHELIYLEIFVKLIQCLSPGDYIGLDEWMTFYHKDYKYVGKLAGLYFDKSGSPTDYYR